MEEVDSIIIHSLRQIGCDLDSGITNLSGFTTELVIEATAKCLNVIRPGLGLPIMLPTNMAARFRLGATLAQACSDLGYRGDIGYQTFLYSSEVDLRRVFMFLIDKLPKEDNKTLSEPTSKPALLDKSIALAVSDSLSVPWLPHYCHNKGSRCRGKTNVSYKTVHLQVPLVERSEEQQTYYAHYQRPVPDQIQDQYCLLPSILSHNLRSIYSTPTNIIERLDWLSNQQHELHVPESILGNDRNLSRLLSNDRLQHDKDTTLEQEESVLSSTPSEKVTSISREEKEELEIEKAKTESEDIRKNVESLQDEIKKLTAKLSQLTVTLQNEDKEFEVKEERRKIKARTYDLLPNDTENIKKLHALIEAHVNKLVDLSNQWERHRDPLIKKYREEREKYSTKTSASLKKTDKLRAFREKEKELLEECRTKDQQYSQLVTEVQKLPKEINRSAYTQRILEIINNVRKQRDEIDKVLADTREIQKEINTITGRVERSFTMVDELIFRDARTNEASRKAYKLLATLHSDCNELITLVEQTGATVREIRDLEEQIDSESTKNVGSNLERITADLKQMKQETAALTVQLQGKIS